MTLAPVLGIDLGTTNSVVAVADGTRVTVLVDSEGNRLVPSVVSFHPQGDVLVGYTARERRLLDAESTVYSVKRLIGRTFDSPEVARARERFAFEMVEGPNKSVLVRVRGQTYTLPEISAYVLREVRRVAERALGVECSQAVITVPANFNELQRAATKAAGKVAGLEVLRILNEPTAAALAYGYGKAGGGRERIAVYDLGGGTFDVTILELSGEIVEVMATAGDTFLGGDDIDVLVADRMAEAFLQRHRFDPRRDPQAYERLRAAAEWSKCQLSREPEVHLRVEELAFGPGGASLDLTFSLSRTALESMVRPLVQRSFEVCEEALRIAGLAATQLDAVILVGGSTRMPIVRQMVREYFGLEARSSIDPDLVVAQGAALQGFALRGNRASLAPATALGRVALKKVAGPSPRAEARRIAIAQETAASRPRGPAFAPRAAPEVARAPVVVPRPAALANRDAAPAARDVPTPDEPAQVMAEPPTSASRSAAPPRGGSIAPPPPPLQPVPPPAVVTAPAVVAGRSIAVGQRSSRVPPPPPRSIPPPAPTPPVPAASSLPVVAMPAPGLAELVDPFALSGIAPSVAPSASPTPDSLEFAASANALPIPAESLPAAPGTMPEGSFGIPSPMLEPSWPSSSLEIVGAGGPTPLLLDVTPQTLGVETVDGYCEPVIRRNAAIPVEQTRVFTTGLDGQSEVRVRIVQGESKRLEENQQLGEILLSGLRQAHRGQVKIGVTFVMNVDGTLGVRATDLDSGREQTIRIHLVGAVTEEEIQQMQERQRRALDA